MSRIKNRDTVTDSTFNVVPPLPGSNVYDFKAASQAVLAFLRDRLGFDLWMVARAEGEDFIILQSQDHGYGKTIDPVFRWTDSFCCQMVAGTGPRIAPEVSTIPIYANTWVAREMNIGAYVGIPLNYRDGSLFGTLCAIDQKPQPENIQNELGLIELLGSMLSSVLSAELDTTEAVRRAERAELAADTDMLTGIYNRRGWEKALEKEEARCRRYGHPACVVCIDLDGLKATNDSLGHQAGDDLICRAGRAIREVARDSDLVARVGGDEFMVLAVECPESSAAALNRRIRQSLRKHNVHASVGLCIRKPDSNLEQASAEADRLMYRDKFSKASAARAS